MIVKLKKLSLLLYHREKLSFLDALQHLGVVHIVEKPDVVSRKLEEKEELLRRCQRVIKTLEALRTEKKLTIEEKEEKDPVAIIANFHEIEGKLPVNLLSIQSMEKDISLLEPWGELDPENMERLESAGIKTRFFKVPTT